MAFDFGELFNSFFQSSASGGSSGAEKHIDNVLSGVDSAVASFFNNTLTRWLQPGVYRQAMRKHLTGAEKEQNAFNAQQAQLQRDFQQSLFNQGVDLENTSFQRQVADMKQAGVNPAIMYGGAGSSGAGVPAAGSGSAASGSASAPADISAFAQLAYIGAQIGLIKAQTRKTETEAVGQDIDNANKPEYWNKQLSLMGANKDEAVANMQNLYQQAATGAADEALKRANERLTNYKITQVDLQNGILAYQAGMAATDAKYYEAMKSLDLALKSATLDAKGEEIKNLRKTRALLQAQIVTEGAKSELFKKQAKSADEFAKYTHKKTTWIDAEEIEKLTNLGQNTELLQYLARKYDAEANYTEFKPTLELLETLGDFVGEVSTAK